MNNQYKSYAYFILFIIIGVWFFMNFINGVIFSNFLEAEKMARHKYLNNDQHLWVEIQKKISKEKPLEYLLSQGKNHQFIYRYIKSKFNKGIIHFSLYLNAIYLSIYYYDSSITYQFILSMIAYLLTIIYFVEMVFHIIAYGIRGYIFFKKGLFKILISLCYLIETLLSIYFKQFIEKQSNEKKILRFFTIFHVLVMIRFFKKFKKLNRLIKSLLFSSKHLISITILIILIFFIYAILGCYLFGKITTGHVVNNSINFNNFFNAIVTLFTCSTHDNWTQIMADCSNVCIINQNNEKICGSSWAATIYFLSFMFLVGQILLNMIILVLMQAFEEFYLNPDQPLKFYEDYVKKFKVFWSKYCLNKFIYYMDERNIILFYQSLGDPLGFLNITINILI